MNLDRVWCVCVKVRDCEKRKEEKKRIRNVEKQFYEERERESCC